jgi:hypothetical protein
MNEVVVPAAAPVMDANVRPCDAAILFAVVETMFAVETRAWWQVPQRARPLSVVTVLSDGK